MIYVQHIQEHVIKKIKKKKCYFLQKGTTAQKATQETIKKIPFLD